MAKWTDNPSRRRLRPPKRVRVSPHEYQVKEEKGLSNVAGVTGACGTDTSKVLYDPDVSDSIARETILHELMHCCWAQTNSAKEYDDKEEEKIVWGLAPRLLALLRDNPELVAYLMEGVE